jgi:hypothetical protein
MICVSVMNMICVCVCVCAYDEVWSGEGGLGREIIR